MDNGVIGESGRSARQARVLQARRPGQELALIQHHPMVEEAAMGRRVKADHARV